MIQLKPITQENLEEVLALRVSDSQQGFVSTTAHSLAQAYAYRDTAFPFAVYAGETLVGFLMFGYYEARKQYTLWKFLIDQCHQGKGYGRALIDHVAKTYAGSFHTLQVGTGDSPATVPFYEKCGFSCVSKHKDGRKLYSINLDSVDLSIKSYYKFLNK